MNQFRRVYETGRRMRDTPVVDDDFPEMMHYFDSAIHALDRLPPMPKIVCLCGSTRFKDEYDAQNERLTLRGIIVLSVGCFRRTQPDGQRPAVEEQVKIGLDELHKRKIDLADEIFVLNVGGYIGSSTLSEIEYARSTGKLISYLEA